MLFQIRKLILWPATGDAPPRTVDFQPATVNVISGASRTGKSAVIPIIDYCLGAGKCAIPVQTIRDACSWFGVLVDTEQGQKLFARRGPGAKQTTNEMWMKEGPSVEIPLTPPQKNTTSESVKAYLDDLAGLSRLDFGSLGESAFRYRPSFRDMVAFTFQPQNIIANPNALFFKADTVEHREKLKNVFPFVLGAVTPEVLAAQHELETVKRDLDRKERELSNLRDVSERWVAELQTWVSQARELGLTDAAPSSDDRNLLLGVLREVVGRRTVAAPDPAAIGEATEELVQLEREEIEVESRLRTLRRRLSEMRKLKENTDRYAEGLATQRDRLSVAKWLETLHADGGGCPVCDRPIDGKPPHLEELLTAVGRVEDDAKRLRGATASFDRELANVRRDSELLVEKLRAISLRKAEAESRSSEARQFSYRASQVARFVGRVEKGLEFHDSLSSDGGLPEEVAALRDRLKQLSALVSRAGVKHRLDRALQAVSTQMGRLLPGLDAEDPDDPVEIAVDDLTLRVVRADRRDYLWEIGSGANWLSYHLASSLALQQHFLRIAAPVPGFLVYDQPSQVYFPRRLASRGGVEEDEAEARLRDEDVDAVRNIFAVLADVVRQSAGKLQVIVLDHAGADVWGRVEGVHLVEEWRDGRKLVPVEWLPTTGSPTQGDFDG